MYTRHTNLRLEDYAPTIDCTYAKQINRQIVSAGGGAEYPIRRRAFNFELWSGECIEVCGGICAKRAHDWIVY